ncbi:MAG TPA: aminoacyl-tRNA hydrolase [Polyangiaceae bacterium]|nr:aminoacyl-tRNA hydrolase [Polyangiaceae bacterium]
MILVVGLGNPGKKYADTRHNVGFVVADRLAARANASFREKFNGRFTELELEGQKIGLLEPQTFMNDSGRSVKAAATFYKVLPGDVLVVHDELDIPFGTLRLKKGGGEAGNNGLRSVSQHLGTKDYVRLRFGIGKPPAGFRGDGADFVLQAFAPEERARLGDLVEQATDTVALFVGKGLDHAMNVTNRRAS